MSTKALSGNGLTVPAAAGSTAVFNRGREIQPPGRAGGMSAVTDPDRARADNRSPSALRGKRKQQQSCRVGKGALFALCPPFPLRMRGDGHAWARALQEPMALPTLQDQLKSKFVGSA